MLEKDIQNTIPISPSTLDLPTSLAVTRTRLAAERTLMSWVRTAFSMISFGFAIIKFFQYLKGTPATVSPSQISNSTKLGAFLILLGLFSLIPGMIEHRKALKLLGAIDGGSRWSYAFIIAILVGLVGIYAFMTGFVDRFF